MIAPDASSGPIAKPVLPPIANRAIPLARRAPLTHPANFAPSGWNAPTPSPDAKTASRSSG